MPLGAVANDAAARASRGCVAGRVVTRSDPTGSAMIAESWRQQRGATVHGRLAT